MTVFKLMCFDFGFPRTSDDICLGVLDIRRYIHDYMSQNGFTHLKLFMKQNDSVNFEYQCDCHLNNGDFYAVRDLMQEGCVVYE